MIDQLRYGHLRAVHVIRQPLRNRVSPGKLFLIAQPRGDYVRQRLGDRRNVRRSRRGETDGELVVGETERPFQENPIAARNKQGSRQLVIREWSYVGVYTAHDLGVAKARPLCLRRCS